MAEAAVPITANSKYETALKYKQDGNAAFKTKNFKLAIRNYHKLVYLYAIVVICRQAQSFFFYCILLFAGIFF